MTERAFITSIDRRAGVITLGTVQEKAGEISALIREIAASDPGYIFRAGDFATNFEVGQEVEFYGPSLRSLLDEEPTALPIAPLVVLTTLAYFSARRVEVAAAEGDYASLLDDFIAWLRRIVTAMRAAKEST